MKKNIIENFLRATKGIISSQHHYNYEYNQNNQGSKKILHILNIL